MFVLTDLKFSCQQESISLLIRYRSWWLWKSMESWTTKI